jgi:hypothetical protein
MGMPALAEKPEAATVARPLSTEPYLLKTAALDAGVPLRDVQEAASHADPRTTMCYDNPWQFHQTRDFLVRKASEILSGPDRAQAVGWELEV